MAIPFFVGVGLKDGAALGVDVTPTLPDNVSDDDVLILHIEGEGEDANADPAPVGWTLITTVASATNGLVSSTRHTLYWHRYNSASPPTLLVPSAGNHTLAIITAWRNCLVTGSPIGPLQTSSDATLDTAVTATGTTTIEDGCAVVVSCSAGDDTGYNTWTNTTLSNPPILPSEVVDAFTPLGSDGSIHVAWGGMPFSGVTGDITVTAVTAGQEANIVFTLRPKPFVVGELTTPTGTVRGFRIWYTDGTNYKSTSNTLPNLRTEWNAQTKTGVMLVIIRYQDKFGIYNKSGIHVERFYREFMPPAAAGSIDWRVWYDPPTRSYGAGTAAQMPALGEFKDYTDSALLAVDNSANASDDVHQTWDAALIAAYAAEYSETERDIS